MIAHISIGVRDIDRSKRFYDAVLEPLGYKSLRAAKSLVGYGYGRDSIAFWVFRAEHPVPAEFGLGLDHGGELGGGAGRGRTDHQVRRCRRHLDPLEPAMMAAGTFDGATRRADREGVDRVTRRAIRAGDDHDLPAGWI